ncbi:MAG: prephenate dehydrogenase dimerization domain-containing protein, partial [Pseudomonadota bacterium]
RIAASDPTMWRDVFLTNKDAVLEMLGAFQEDLSKLTRAIRRGIVSIGQDAASADFGRPHASLAKKD